MTTAKTRVRWNHTPALEAAEKGGKDGLEKASDFILALANEHVPFELGGLARSGKVDWSGTVASVYYDTPYAKKLHQDRRLKIKNGREGLWLRKAVLKSKPSVVQYFAGALKLAFRGARRKIRVP